MKFKIEIDEESISEDNIRYEVAQHIANKIYSNLNLELLKKEANTELEKKKDACLKGVKLEIESWDKSALMYEVMGKIEKSLIEKVAEKVFEKLKSNSDFVGKVSAEIIKTKFS